MEVLKMKKSLLLVGIFLIIGLFLTGCATNTQTTATNQNTEKVDNSNTLNTQENTDNTQIVEENNQNAEKIKFTSIDNLLDNLRTNFELGEKEETYYQMIGAYDGTKIDVDQTKIEIYQYKDSQREAMISAQDTMDTADNQIFIIEDNYLILVHSIDSEFSDNLKDALN